jgi:hypothetical protein
MESFKAGDVFEPRSQFTLTLAAPRGRRSCASGDVHMRSVTAWADGSALRAPNYPAIDEARAGPARLAEWRE